VIYVVWISTSSTIMMLGKTSSVLESLWSVRAFRGWMLQWQMVGMCEPR
jgi:hypothetical protein